MKRFIKFPALLYPVFFSLSLAQSRVLWIIVRQTIGWHKSRDAISLRQFQYGIGQEPGTGMSRTHIIGAIRCLEAKQIIRVVRQVTAEGISSTSIYSLAERFLDEDGPTVEIAASDLDALSSRLSRGTVSSGHHGGGHETRPTINKPCSKETSSSSASLDCSTDDDEPICARTPHSTASCEAPEESVGIEPSPLPQDRPSVALEQTPVPTEVVPTHESVCELPTGEIDLLDSLKPRLKSLGFADRVAQQLLGKYAPEKVRLALDHLPFRKAQNPAGYLLSELKAGDFAKPDALKSRPRVFGLPQPTPQQQVQAQEQAVVTSKLQVVIASLTTDMRATLWEEARRKCARVGYKAAPEDSPILKAQFELIVEDRLLRNVG